MNRKSNCIACRFQKDGVKTRKSLVHTCGKTDYQQLWDKVVQRNISVGNEGEIEHCNAFTDLEGKYYVPKKFQYLIGVDAYDGTDGVTTISVLKKDEYGNIIVEYMGRTNSKEEYEKTIKQLEQDYPTAIKLEWIF